MLDPFPLEETLGYLLSPWEDALEGSYWVAECASLPGCISQGRTKEEAIANIREAIAGYIAALEEDGLPVPEERFYAEQWYLRLDLTAY